MAGSNSCLGIYFDKNFVKYAKLEKAGDGTLNIKNHAVKFVKDQNIKDAIYAAISEANSMDIPVVINAPDAKYSGFKILRQISGNDRNNIIRLEFEEWCDKNAKAIDEYMYVQTISEIVQEEHYSGEIAIASKAGVKQYEEIGPKKINAMFPYEFSLIAPNNVDDYNYILVNLDETLSVSTVINNKKTETNFYEIGMNQILLQFEDLLGSYTKAYEACKEINVFSDSDNSTNKVQFEQIVEPVLQEVLQRLQDTVNRNRSNISKIYITGMGTLFTNIDTLFTEYFNIRTEIYKPRFISEIGDVRNMSEVLEVLPAISLAKFYLDNPKSQLDFLKAQYSAKKVPFSSRVRGLFGGNKKTKANVKVRHSAGLDIEKIQSILVYPAALLITVVIGYNVFTNIYISKMDGYISEYNAKISEYNDVIKNIDADRTVISSSATKYKTVNDRVDDLITQVNNNEIGRFTTNNLASFMQKLAKIMPKNVTLTFIQSDDKKHITIGAKSNRYPDLGYLVANLRLSPDILKNIEITKVENSSSITIEIEGDLP
ncbi:MAG: hypothetical protein IJ809_00695 [Clostridia bacterium]|nr:hypothetical protein [Clostridia bacterium]